VLIDVLNKIPLLSAQIDLRDEIKALPVFSPSETIRDDLYATAKTQVDK